MKAFECPFPTEADAYQLGHEFLIPRGMSDFQLSLASYRRQLRYEGDGGADMRVVSAGIMPFALLELENRILKEGEVETADWLLNTFHADTKPPYAKPYPYPKEIFRRVVREFGGRLPVCLMAIPDGQAHFIGEPHALLWTDVPGMGELVGWLESTLGPYCWTSSAVATRGRVRKAKFVKLFKELYPELTHAEVLQWVAYLFHDFGRRGAAASQITGIAHLLNWLGTDTVDAAFAAAWYLNNKKTFGACSIMAGAHRTVTTHPTHNAAMRQLIERFGDGLCAEVIDSYGTEFGFNDLADVAAPVIGKMGGKIIGRPDSGDPVESVLLGLHIFEKKFGVTKRPNGLKVLINSGIIQGDGVSDKAIFEKIYPAVIGAGFCPSNVAFGMGEYNHRAVRSDLEWALKTSLVGTVNPDGTPGPDRKVMKWSDSAFKRSIPGAVSIHLNGPLDRRVRPITREQLVRGEVGDYRVVYDGRPNPLPLSRWTFDESRALTLESWDKIPGIVGDTTDPAIRADQVEYMATVAKNAAR